MKRSAFMNGLIGTGFIILVAAIFISIKIL